MVCLEKPSPDQLAALGGLSASGARLLVLHVEPTACTAGVALATDPGSQLHMALAAAREMLPPFSGVLHAPVPADAAAAAAAAVAAAQAALRAASVPAASPAVEVVGISAASAAADEAAVRSMVVTALGALLGEPAAHAVGADEPLMSAGLTSTLAVQLTQRLEEALSKELPGTLVFDYPTINEMAAFLAAELAGPAVPAAPSGPAAAPCEAAAPRAAAAPPSAALHAVSPAPAVSKEQQDASAVALVLQQAGQLMGGLAAASLAADTPLMSAGLTSTLAVQLTQLLEEAVGSELPGTLVFDYPTPAEIAGYLVSEGLLGPAAAAGTTHAAGNAAAAAAAPASAGAAAAAEQQRAQLVALVLQEATGLVGSAGASLAADQPLMSGGLTSTMAVQLVAALERNLGAELPGTLVFDYPTGGLWGVCGGRGGAHLGDSAWSLGGKGGAMLRMPGCSNGASCSCRAGCRV